MSQSPFSELPRLEPPKISSRMAGFAVLAFLVLVLLSTSFYQVEPEEAGVVLRFGKYHKTTEPGLHFKLPFSIDKVYPVPIQRQLNEELGFRSQLRDSRRQVGGRQITAKVDVAGESNMLTGDLNAAVVEWVVQYRIVEPFKFLFQVRNVQETFRDMSEAVMREVVGDRTVNEVLTVGRQEVANVVREKLQALCEDYNTGIAVDQVVLQDVTPPDEVKPAFNEVNQAQQEREKLINEAQSEYNKEVPRAEGEAQQIIAAAEGYEIDRVNRAEGEASRFTALYDEYRKAPEVTRKRIYLETLDEVLPGVKTKVIIDDDAQGVLPLLNLGGGSLVGGGS